MTDRSPFSRFQDLLSDIFQFETGDLDFGIYRILNAKRKQVEAFITGDLQTVVDQAFGQYAATKSAVVADDLEAERAKVIAAFGDTAFDANGQLVLYENTPLGQAYLVKERAASLTTATDSLKAKVYNDLLTFFARYYDEGDFLPLRRAGREMTYAIPYNGEEVVLHWANKGQYYIKTDDRLAAYRFRAGTGHVVLEVRSAAVEQNNNKGARRYYILADDGPDTPAVRYDTDAQTLHVFFVQRPLSEAEEKEFGKNENQRPQDRLNAATFEAVLARVPDTSLRASLAAPYAPKEGESAVAGAPPTFLRHLSQFTKKNTADFFIHKNLSVFLRGELDQFIKTECLRLDELLNGGEGDYALQTARARATHQVGGKIIALLASVEDFQRKLFEKRKFVTATHYVFTLDRVPAALHRRVLANPAQVHEWRDLYGVDEMLAADGILGEGGLTAAALEGEPYRRLPVDTRHFDAAFKAELLGSVDDLDALTDGVLFNSENFQALALMTETYRSRVKCIYIDPPYNTAASEILYKNEYKHSAWLALVENRISLSKSLLRGDGIICVTIDDAEVHGLWYVLCSVFNASNHLGTTPIRNNPQGRATVNGFAVNHEYAIFLSRENGVAVGRLEHSQKQRERYGEVDEAGKSFLWENFRKTGTDSQRGDRPKQFYPMYISGIDFRVPSMDWVEERKAWEVEENPAPGETVLWPIDDNGTERVWKWGFDRVLKFPSHIKVVIGTDGMPQVYRRNYLNEDGSLPGTWWDKAKYAAGSHGTNLLSDLFGTGRSFLYPKSLYAVEDCLLVSGLYDDSVVLDYFAGSGTTGHAVINLNRGAEADGSDERRKYTLVEMGEYFGSVLLPRLKKATFASGWHDGKPTSRDAVSQTLKYHTLEQYEDTLNNLQLRPEAESQQALDVFGDDYLLRYMLDFDTAGSPSLLNVASLADPLDYTLRVKSGDDFIHQAVDLPETFSYLLGLRVRKVRSFNDAGREYRAVLGEKDGRLIAHVWRKSSDLADEADGLARDAAFVVGTVLPALAPAWPDRVFVNGAFTLPDAENCEPELFRLMFAPVGA